MALAVRLGAVHLVAMEWAGAGLVLAMRPHGETSAILEVFSADRGRHAGVVRGGAGRRLGPHLQPGNEVALRWRARLEGQLGQFTVEPLKGRAGQLMESRLSLAALSSVCALLQRALPEREPHPALHAATLALLDALATLPDWRLPYLKWELGLLAEIGYGLDLSQCAVTGARQGLAFVSPKTGRAVTHEGAGPWQDRLLPLPPCLTSSALIAPDLREMTEALALTQHFLNRGLGAASGETAVPEARLRLADLLGRLTPTSSPT